MVNELKAVSFSMNISPLVRLFWQRKYREVGFLDLLNRKRKCFGKCIGQYKKLHIYLKQQSCANVFTMAVKQMYRNRAWSTCTSTAYVFELLWNFNRNVSLKMGKQFKLFSYNLNPWLHEDMRQIFCLLSCGFLGKYFSSQML